MPTFGSIIGVGVPGETGPAGPTGPTGPQGPTGPAGPSAPLSDATPAALGSAAAGVSTDASRADHVHAMPSAADVGALAAIAGSNGGVMVYAGGAWASTGAGTERQILTSAGAGAATWGADVVPLTQRAIDGLGTSVTTCAVIAHDLNAGGGGDGIGARCAIQNRNSAGALVDTAAIDGVLTTAMSGSEVGALDVRVRSSGSLARVARFGPSSLRLEWAARAITVLGFGGTDLDVWRVDGSSRWAFGSTDAANCGGLILYTPSTADVAVYRGATVHWQVDSSGATTIGTTGHATTLRGSTLTIGLSTVVAVYQGGARVPRVTISSSTTLDASHEVVHVDTTGGAVTITLPPPSEGRLITIQRKRGANNLVVQRNGSETIRTGGANVNSTTIADDSRHSFIYDADSGEWSMEA